MKWVTFEPVDGVECGVVDGELVYPHAGTESLLELIELDQLKAAGEKAMATSSGRPVASLSIAAPLVPPTMRDAMCFHEHIRNSLGPEIDARHSLYPAFYFTNRAAVVGPYDDVAISPGSLQFDFEVEVAAVIGTAGENIRPADAARHVIGYAIYVDWSARDLQFDEMALKLGAVKGKDSATTLGPYLVTTDELEPYRSGKGFDLPMTARLNGRLITAGNWKTIDWSFDDVVAYASRGTKLNPGDVIGSGTVGLGCLLEHQLTGSAAFEGWLTPGDVVEVEVGMLGKTSQRILPPLERHPLSSGW